MVGEVLFIKHFQRQCRFGRFSAICTSGIIGDPNRKYALTPMTVMSIRPRTNPRRYLNVRKHPTLDRLIQDVIHGDQVLISGLDSL